MCIDDTCSYSYDIVILLCFCPNKIFSMCKYGEDCEDSVAIYCWV
jgi:hypothetical protein